MNFNFILVKDVSGLTDDASENKCWFCSTKKDVETALKKDIEYEIEEQGAEELEDLCEQYYLLFDATGKCIKSLVASGVAEMQKIVKVHINLDLGE